MNKIAVFVLAVAACAMASVLPKTFCSVTAEGTAQFLGANWTAKMYRVKDTARYEIHTEGAVAYIFARPDIGTNGTTFFYTNHSQLPGCIERDFISLDDYVYDDTQKAFKAETEGFGSALFFNEKDVLVKEVITLVVYTKQGDLPVPVTVTFTTYDNTYVHNEKDDLFSFDQDSCSAELKTNATDAVTSEQCQPVPEPSSSSQKPVPAFSSSSKKPVPTSSSKKPAPSSSASFILEMNSSFVMCSTPKLICCVIKNFTFVFL